MTVDELWDRYAELTAEEPLSLEEFVEMAASGRLSGEPVDPDTLQRFLRRVEGMMLANIETKLQEAPHFHPMREEAVERTQAMIADLIARFATSRPQRPPSDPSPSGGPQEASPGPG